jgi:hypothetical protein
MAKVLRTGKKTRPKNGRQRQTLPLRHVPEKKPETTRAFQGGIRATVAEVRSLTCHAEAAIEVPH